MLQLQVYVDIVLSDMGLEFSCWVSSIGSAYAAHHEAQSQREDKSGNRLTGLCSPAPGWQGLCLFAPLSLHPQCPFCLVNDSVILGWCPIPLSDLPQHPCLAASEPLHPRPEEPWHRRPQHFPGVAQRRGQNPWRPSPCHREVLHVLLVCSDPWRVQVHFLANVTPSRDLSGTRLPLSESKF